MPNLPKGYSQQAVERLLQDHKCAVPFSCCSDTLPRQHRYARFFFAAVGDGQSIVEW